MFKLPKPVLAIALLASMTAGASYAENYQIGTAATAIQIAGWDIDIRQTAKAFLSVVVTRLMVRKATKSSVLRAMASLVKGRAVGQFSWW